MTLNKKYELTSGGIKYFGRKLYRIRALRDFGNIKAGELGGYIESEENLSHEGLCWVYYSAWVYDGVRVCDDAWVGSNARLSGNALIASRSEEVKS